MVAECVVLVEAGAGAATAAGAAGAAGWSAGIEFLMRKGEGVLLVPTTLPFPTMLMPQSTSIRKLPRRSPGIDGAEAAARGDAGIVSSRRVTSA